VETRLLILNADPVFQDRALAILDEIDGIETRVVRTMSEAVFVLLGENFDGFVVEGENPIAIEQATNSGKPQAIAEKIAMPRPARGRCSCRIGPGCARIGVGCARVGPPCGRYM